MNEGSKTSVPEKFKTAYDTLLFENFPFTNLLITLKYAARYDQKGEDPNPLGGPCWLTLFDHSIIPAANALTALVSDFTKECSKLSWPKGSPSEEISEAIAGLVKQASQLHTTAVLFQYAAKDEAESGHDPDVDWPTAFETLIDGLARIDKIADLIFDAAAARDRQPGGQKPARR